MTKPNPDRVARGFLRQAGVIQFVKDQSSAGSGGNWAWSGVRGEAREKVKGHVFQTRHLKPLVEMLNSVLMALGHATSAQTRLVKIKSRDVSPDGNLGGKGYIFKISDMRKSLMNCVEALSAISDTLYDEVSAPHWSPDSDEMSPRDRDEVLQLVHQIEAIKDDPEAWAGQEEEEELEQTAEAASQKEAGSGVYKAAAYASAAEGALKTGNVSEAAELLRGVGVTLAREARRRK